VKNKFIFWLSLVLCIFLPLTACSSSRVAKDLMADVEAADWPTNPDLPPDDYVKAVSDFSVNLLAASLNQKGNILLSPASVYLALSMTMNGADGKTLEAMKEALASAELTEEELNEAARNWITLLQQTGERTELFVSNSIWVRDAYPVNRTFLQRNADYYGAAVKALDFGRPEAVDAINDWVKRATRGKIDQIIDSIDENVMMYLMNAIYFKSDWKDPFAANQTADRTFNAPDGPVTVPFMHQSAKMAYLEEEGVQGICLPYVDESFAFFAILPEEDVRSYVSELDRDTLSRLIENQKAADVELSIPKFEIRYEDCLKNELSKLGMDIAFGMDADFSRMSESGLSDLFISDVRHKTFCRVDEKGTEAAAVTSVEMRQTSIPANEKTLIFDKPFLFGILDTRTNLPLFLGIMENPKT